MRRVIIYVMSIENYGPNMVKINKLYDLVKVKNLN